MIDRAEMKGRNDSTERASRVDVIRCLAVGRGTQHAAKHVSNDAIMFDLVCKGLREYGWAVELISESDLSTTLESRVDADCIISMAQRPENVDLLREKEERGALIVNTPGSVTNCYRTNLVEILGDSEVPFGRSVTVGSSGLSYDGIAERLGMSFWLKRGDIHAAHQDDVILIESPEAFDIAVDGFRSRGVDTLVAQEHLVGEVVKFYAVRGTDFFHAQYFESEEDVSFDLDRLRQIGEQAASSTGLTIYGGDVVMTSEAGPVLIDLNPWPSFGRVRERGAPRMVEAIRAMVGSS